MDIPKPYYQDSHVTIYVGDCLEVLSQITGVTAVVTDPPYGLNFMGKDWDHGIPGKHFWETISKACLPGAPLLSFGGTRTYHRLTCAIEDAGWEIRDCLMWIYGSGFPKSLDVGKAIDKAAGVEREVVGIRTDGNKGGGANTYDDDAYVWDKPPPVTTPTTPAAQLWDGYGTALKPAYEPIVLARKPLEGTVAQNVQKYGTGALWIDGGRVESPDEVPKPRGRIRSKRGKFESERDNDYELIEPPEPNSKGRWPANVIHDGSDEVVELFPDSKVSGSAKSGRPAIRNDYDNSKNVYGAGIGAKQGRLHNDSGSAARFFYSAKASKSERNAGIDGRNDHPTVKSIALMRYLLTLLTQPQRNLILDPFMGSGTTLRAAKDLGLHSIGIEIEEKYCELAAKSMAQLVLPL